MANTNKKRPRPNPAKSGSKIIIGIAVGLVVLGGVLYATYGPKSPPPEKAAAPTPQAATNAELPVKEINTAVMVTVELDFGPKVPTPAEAIFEIERRYKPDDGKGRTFAILDAYGGPTADGKKLHMQMHVSTEKPGTGALIFKRTGQVLWESRIIATNSNYFTGKNLLILYADAEGKGFTIDGSRGPATILDATLKESGAVLRDVWPDGAEREFTYMYSACGCPVKVKVRRVGEKTERVKKDDALFPDDPDALHLISRLMAWF